MTAVLVLYGMSAESSSAFTGLRDLLLATPRLGSGLNVFLYDNSAVPSPLPHFPVPVLYRHDPTNGGIAAGYNAALEAARTSGSEWLLLLDQDTVLTEAYFAELRSLTTTVPPEVAAIIPRLQQGGHVHSPQRLPRPIHRPLPAGTAGLLQEVVLPYNSGAAIRVSAVKRFPERYWLDFLDHAIFHELQAAGGRIWLMQARLEHSLSTTELGQAASTGRYLNMLQAERDFYQEYGSFSDSAFYRIRSVRQALSQLARVPDKRFAWLSLRAALGWLPPTPKRGTR